MVKKYFIDREFYSLNDDKMHGDMGFTFCDMPSVAYNTFEEAEEDVIYGIEYEKKEQIDNNVEFDGEVDVYMVVEYEFEDEDYIFPDISMEHRVVKAYMQENCIADKVRKAWDYNCEIKTV